MSKQDCTCSHTAEAHYDAYEKDYYRCHICSCAQYRTSPLRADGLEAIEQELLQYFSITDASPTARYVTKTIEQIAQFVLQDRRKMEAERLRAKIEEATLQCQVIAAIKELAGDINNVLTAAHKRRAQLEALTTGGTQ